MIHIKQNQPAPLRIVRNDIENLIAIHGHWHVIRAVVATLAKVRGPRLSRYDPRHLNDHLKRDIGMERDAPPRPHWDLGP